MNGQATEEKKDWRYYVKRFFVLLIYCIWLLWLNRRETPQILVVGVAFLPGLIVMKMKVKRWVVLLVGGLAVIADGVLIYYICKLGLLATTPVGETANFAFLVAFLIGFTIVPSLFPNFARNRKAYLPVVLLLVLSSVPILEVLERGNYLTIPPYLVLAALLLYVTFSKEEPQVSKLSFGQRPLWGSWKFKDEKEN